MAGRGGFELFEARDEQAALNQLLRDARGPLLTFGQEVALARRMRGEDAVVPPPGASRPTAAEARDRLVTANVRLVVNVARRYVGRGVAIEDLVQEGLLGLQQAVEKFDPDRGFRLSTYVTWWIRQATGRALQNQAHAVRIPVHVGGRIRRLVEAEGQLLAELEEAPTAAMVADRAGVDRDEALAMRRAATTPASIDQFVAPGDDDPGDTVAALFLADGADVAEEAADRDAAAGVRYALTFLGPRERTVLALRFGVGQARPFSLQEAGQVLGVTRERARQIELDGMAVVRADPFLVRMFGALAG